MTRRVHIYVSGRVQGVFFRAATQAKAKQLNITGWVKNLLDGRVEIVAEAESQAMAPFLAWCRKGPPGADVQTLQINDEPSQNDFTDFCVRLNR